MKLALIPLSIFLATTLVACSSSDDDNTSPIDPNPGTDPPSTSDNITQWGLVELDTEEEVDIVGVFGRFTGDYTEDQFEEDLLPELDVCEVKTVAIGTDDGDDDLSFDFAVDFDTISAGDAITLSTIAGTYATLVPDNTGDLAIYALEEGPALEGPAPSSLVVDIPGADFPAFMSAAIPDVAELDFSSPAEGEAITPSTAFVWVAGSAVNSIVDISATFENTGAGTEVTVECTVQDDGTFGFNANTQAEMGAGFMGATVDYSRTRYEFIESGTSVLVVSNGADS